MVKIFTLPTQNSNWWKRPQASSLLQSNVSFSKDSKLFQIKSSSSIKCNYIFNIPVCSPTMDVAQCWLPILIKTRIQSHLFSNYANSLQISQQTYSMLVCCETYQWWPHSLMIHTANCHLHCVCNHLYQTLKYNNNPRMVHLRNKSELFY